VLVSGKDDKGTSAPPTANGSSDAGVSSGAPQQDAGAMADNKHATCSVATPGAHKGSTGFVLGVALLGLGLITRKRARR
jgi:MYXO-CTERM domain-containing protein